LAEAVENNAPTHLGNGAKSTIVYDGMELATICRVRTYHPLLRPSLLTIGLRRESRGASRSAARCEKGCAMIPHSKKTKNPPTLGVGDAEITAARGVPDRRLYDNDVVPDAQVRGALD